MRHFHLFFLLGLVCLGVKPTSALNCYSCHHVDGQYSCNTTLSCADNEVCFLEVQGKTYTMGCANNQLCGGVGVPGLVGRGVESRQTSDCRECCSTDLCNSEMCKHLKPTQCVDDPTMDCARLNSLFHVCQDIHQASLVCPKFCNLCQLVDGNWAQWSPWSSCDVTCGNSTIIRTRTCTDPKPAYGGLDCVGNPNETKYCHKEPCPVHGGWSPWSSWGACSVTCGVGMERRDRTCSNPFPSNFGDHCYGDGRDDRVCLSSACTDGNWSTWGPWGTCTGSCGLGLKTRQRTCTSPTPSLLGRGCDGSPEEMIPCFNTPCSDGGWSTWDPWGACSDSCGGGVRSRLRTCTNPKPSLLGRYCDGSPEEITTCNKTPCPDKKVAFTAYGINVNSGQLIFPYVYQNYGNGYNSVTGKFTCRVPGIYYFSSTLNKKFTENTDYVQCYLILDSISLVGAYENPEDREKGDNSAYSFTISSTIHLSTGDTVYIGLCTGASYLYNDNRSSFTGVLIIPD